MFTPENPPTESDYLTALESIEISLNEKDVQMLKLQFEQPGHAITSQLIRDLFRYKGIATSNANYGKLGHKIADAVGFQTNSPKVRRPDWWQAISTGKRQGKHFTWTMRPDLAQALVAFGLVNPTASATSAPPDVDIHDAKFSATEAGKKLVTHLRRERNPALKREKIAGVDSLACEICGFDFSKQYGVEYCEIHHLIPLAESDGERITSLDELAIVCANCHRVIHHVNPPLTLLQVRNLIAAAT